MSLFLENAGGWRVCPDLCDKDVFHYFGFQAFQRVRNFEVGGLETHSALGYLVLGLFSPRRDKTQPTYSYLYESKTC